jgi:periplasmic copper chaperone A
VKTSRGVGVGLAVVGLLIAMSMVYFAFADRDAGRSFDRGSATRLVISEGRFVLPPTVEQPAELYFKIANRGEEAVYVTEVAVRQAREADFFDLSTPDPLRAANVEVEPGEMVSLEPGGLAVQVSGYTSDVVPGAAVDVDLRLGNGETVSTRAQVEAAPSAVQRARTGEGTTPR